MTNVALLKETFAYIEANPSEWDQRQYICDTGMCFAGHAVALSGFHLDEDACTPVELLPPNLRTKFQFHAGGVVHASDLAAALLDIEDCSLSTFEDPTWSEWAPEVLFAAFNGLEDLRHYVKQLCDQAAPVLVPSQRTPSDAS
jgi:hypothetical protein